MSVGPGADRWREVDALFQRALDRPAEERARFVREEAGADDELAGEVLALLAATEEASELLERPLAFPDGLEWSELHDVLAHGASGGADSLVDRTGEMVGPFRLLRLLGRGGMASVYLGERADGQWDQHVAVKVVRRGLDTGDVIRRFIAERQILSGLRHPNIARLLDGGMTHDGLPYLVMEWVDGRTITDHCREEALPLPERLRLFCLVARAVDHAHKKLVVHRDLKPSNVLVDRNGVPVLLDFGIAKVLGTDGADPEGLTRTGLRVMTPEYASPEQLRGAPSTTASDVYQLGVLLGVLISGRRPNEPPGARRFPTTSPTADVLPPSRLVDEAFARSCSTSLDRARTRLRGDLDTIVLKALREDPEDRYPGAGALADDLERHLSRRPIRARPATLRYRSAKFVRRRPWVAASMAGVALALGVYGSTLVRHERQLEAERNLARLEADRARQVQAFLVDVFRSPDPYVASDPERTAEVTVRESLALGAARAREELADRPAILGALLGAVADVYTSLGLASQADSLHEEALLLTQAGYGGASAETVYRLRMLGQNRLADGRASSAIEVLERSLALAGTLAESGDTATIHALNQIGRAHMALGEFEEARRRLESAVSMARLLDPPRMELLTDVHVLLAQVYPELNRLGEAVRSAERARELSLAAHGDRHPRTGLVSIGLAAALVLADRSREAVPLYREGIDVLSDVLGPEHPDVVAAKGNFALCLNRLGEHAAAERLQREVLEAQLRGAGGDSTRVATAIQNLAVYVREQGRLAEAEDLLDRAYRASEGAHPEGNYRTAMPLLTLSEIQLDRGDFAAAEGTAGRALAILSDELPPGHYATAVGRCRLGRSMVGQGRTGEGLVHLERAAGEIAAAPVTPAGYRRECLGAFMGVLRATGDVDRAAEVQRLLDGGA